MNDNCTTVEYTGLGIVCAHRAYSNHPAGAIWLEFQPEGNDRRSDIAVVSERDGAIEIATFADLKSETSTYYKDVSGIGGITGRNCTLYPSHREMGLDEDDAYASAETGQGTLYAYRDNDHIEIRLEPNGIDGQVLLLTIGSDSNKRLKIVSYADALSDSPTRIEYIEGHGTAQNERQEEKTAHGSNLTAVRCERACTCQENGCCTAGCIALNSAGECVCFQKKEATSGCAGVHKPEVGTVRARHAENSTCPGIDIFYQQALNGEERRIASITEKESRLMITTFTDLGSTDPTYHAAVTGIEAIAKRECTAVTGHGDNAPSPEKNGETAVKVTGATLYAEPADNVLEIMIEPDGTALEAILAAIELSKEDGVRVVSYADIRADIPTNIEYLKDTGN